MEDLGILSFIEEEGEFTRGIDLRMVHGHTPGQIIPIIRYEEKTIVFGADLFPMAAHIPVKYNMAYDIEVLKTMEEKERFLKEIYNKGYAVLFQHDTKHECGTIKIGKRGYQLDSSFTLKSFIQS